MVSKFAKIPQIVKTIKKPILICGMDNFIYQFFDGNLSNTDAALLHVFRQAQNSTVNVKLQHYCRLCHFSKLQILTAHLLQKLL